MPEGGSFALLLARLRAGAHGPSPEEAARVAELAEQLLETLEPRQRDIVQRTLRGQAPPEVSAALGCSERTVKRVVARVQDWLERRQAEDAPRS